VNNVVKIKSALRALNAKASQNMREINHRAPVKKRFLLIASN
jgi:hypothetical protein